MSRGPGIWQRPILERLENVPLAALGARDRSEYSAILRAAKALEKAGKCVLIRLWNNEHTRVITHVARPGHVLKDGTPLQSLSVERVTSGTRSTFRGSVRQLAWQEGVSPTQIWRDLQEAKRQGE
jgi:hypothetical protein